MSDVEVYTVKLHGSAKQYVLLAASGSNQDKLLQDLRKLRYCSIVKRSVKELEDPEQIKTVYEKIKSAF